MNYYLVKRDTRHHLKKVYSALTLTLLAAVGGAVLAKSFPLLANPFLVLGASLYLIFSLGKFLLTDCIFANTTGI